MFINISVCFQVVKLLKISTTSLAVTVVALLDWRLDLFQLTTKQLCFLEVVICKQNLVHYKLKTIDSMSLPYGDHFHYLVERDYICYSLL